jgi:protein TonB
MAIWGAARGMTLNSNIDAIKAAIDPSRTPAIAEPIFPAKHPFPEFGPPGPYTPERPSRLGIGGVAVIECALALNGHLNKCTLLADGPLGFNFGNAALRMAQTGYLKAKSPEGFSDGDQVRVIVTFPAPRGSLR